MLVLALAFTNCFAAPIAAPSELVPDTVRASGFEQLKQGHPHPFTILRSKKRFLYECTRGIDGALSGVLRSEVNGPSGAYTWLSGSPAFVLKLPAPTAPNLFATIAPSRMNRSQASGSLASTRANQGENTLLLGRGTVASRSCSVVSFTDLTPLEQKLWIDEDSGIVLRQVDRLDGIVIYRRQFDQIETGIGIPETVFQLPVNTVVIRGVVSPEILVAANASPNPGSYEADLASIRSRSGLDAGSWILPVQPPQGFDYAESNEYERGAGKLFPDYANPLTRQCPESEIKPFGLVPSGWADGAWAPRGRGYGRSLLPLDSRGASRGVPPPVAYQAPDGKILSFGAARSNGAATKPIAGESEAIVRSEFLNRQTGDTIAFFQIRNVPMVVAFQGLRLSGPKALSTQVHPQMFGYTVSEPCAINILEWRVGPTDYVLAATGLDLQTLERMADQVT